MATLKKMNSKGSFDYVQVTGEDVTKLRQDLENTSQRLEDTSQQLAQNVHQIKLTHSQAEIQNIISSARHVIFETGEYNLSEIMLPSNIILDLQGSTLKSVPQPTQKSVFKGIEKDNITVKNGTIDGSREFHGDNMSGGQSGGNHGISIVACKNVFLENLNLINCGADGLYVGETKGIGCKNITAVNCKFDNNMRQGMSVTHLVGAKFENCEFTNTNGKSPEAGADFEPNNDSAKIENIELINCTFTNNSGRGLIFYLANTNYKNIVLDNVTSKNHSEYDVRVSTPSSSTLIFIENIVIKNSNIGLLSFDGVVRVDKLNIQCTHVKTLEIAPCQEATIQHTTIQYFKLFGSNREEIKQISFKDCTFDGKTIEKDGMASWAEQGKADVMVDTCYFQNYYRRAIQSFGDITIKNCHFKNNNITESTNVIEPPGRSDVNVNIFNCMFLKNNNNATPIRLPSQTIGLVAINNISDVAFPTNASNNIKSNLVV